MSERPQAEPNPAPEALKTLGKLRVVLLRDAPLFGAQCEDYARVVVAAEAAVEAERQRHAEEVAELREQTQRWRSDALANTRAGRPLLSQLAEERDSLRGQLRRVEGERDEALEESKGWQRTASSLESRLLELESYKRGLEQRKLLEGLPLPQNVVDDLAELTALRAHDADVRVCAEWVTEQLVERGHIPAVAAGAAERLLAADFLREGGGETELPSGTPWHQVDDGAFASPFGTIRKCIDCDCLVAGGPTRCRRCVDALSAKDPTP